MAIRSPSYDNKENLPIKFIQPQPQQAQYFNQSSPRQQKSGSNLSDLIKLEVREQMELFRKQLSETYEGVLKECHNQNVYTKE